MSTSKISTRSELVSYMGSAWADLQSSLSGLSEKQMTDLRDDQGWNIRDHITHLAAWEDSVAMLFEGKPRHATLGVEQSLFMSGSFDEINDSVRERWQELSAASALERLRAVHATLLVSVEKLSDASLAMPAAKFFTQVPASDPRSVLDIILANSARHFREHLPWIKEISRSEG